MFFLTESKFLYRELLGDQTTIQEVIDFLKNPVPSEAAC